MKALFLAWFDESTQKTRLKPAFELASKLGHSEVDFDHLLFVDANATDSDLAKMLSKDSLQQLQLALKEQLDNLQPAKGTASPAAELFALAKELSASGTVSWHSLFGAILGFRPHRIVPIIQDFGLQSYTMTAASLNSNREAGAEKTVALDDFSLDLTDLARRGELSDSIGRDQEIERVLSILSRRYSNNAILVGHPGVGKTKIIEGIAVRISQGTTPDRLRNIRILSLDLGKLVAGASYRGQFEERLRVVLRELKSTKGKVILFIDEIHQLLGLGATSGAMDAANLMKPALSRGELWCVGATTFREYRQIQQDGALRRRFQKVVVDELPRQELKKVLNSTCCDLARFHNVTIKDEAIDAAIRLSSRFLAETRSPAREVDLLDEMCASRSLICSQFPDTVNYLDARDVMETVATITGLPVGSLSLAERGIIAELDVRLKKRIFGQDAAVNAAVDVLYRSFAGLCDSRKPRGLLLCVGPTGVGKTELAKGIAKELFGSERLLVRLDMSECSDKSSISTIVGAPPGTVGYEEGGKLTSEVHKTPYCVVLLDEFEKAHPSIWRLFLQLFDEGHLTDNVLGRVSFKEAIIVITSNVGGVALTKFNELTRRLQKLKPGTDESGVEQSETAQEIFDSILRSVPNLSQSMFSLFEREARRITEELDIEKTSDVDLILTAFAALPEFPPEMLGRLGMPIAFRELDEELLRLVLNKELFELGCRVLDAVIPERPVDLQFDKTVCVQDGCVVCRDADGKLISKIILTDELVEDILHRASDSRLGARMIQTQLQSRVESVVARAIVSGAHTEIKIGESQRVNN